MMDTQTRSLWSHILGEAMSGELEGTQLTAIPSDMVTWEAWKGAHGETTVLAMPRTRHEAYTKEFYRDAARFVVGFSGGDGIYHCSLGTLKRVPLLNIDAGGLPLLITFDPESTSVRMFSRGLGDRVQWFTTDGATIRDKQTGSTWDRQSGRAIAGPLAGERLDARVGIVSYAKAWAIFHPDSRKIGEEAGSR